MDKDQSSTLAGGLAGLYLLNQVQWNTLPYGGDTQVLVALLLIALGYIFYRSNGGPTAHV